MTYMGDISNTTAAQQRMTAARMSVCLQTALQTNETPSKLPERRSVKRARESDSHLWKMLEEENQKAGSLDPSSNHTRNLRVRVPVSLGTMQQFRRLPKHPNTQLLLLVNDADGKQIQVQLIAIVDAWSGMCLHVTSVPSASSTDGIDDAIRQAFQRARSAALQLGVTAEAVTDDVPVLRTAHADGSCSWPGAGVFWAALREHGGGSAHSGGGATSLAGNVYRWPCPAMLQTFMTTWNTSRASIAAVLGAVAEAAHPILGASSWRASLEAAASGNTAVPAAAAVASAMTPQALWVAGVVAGGAAAPAPCSLAPASMLPAALQPAPNTAMAFPVAPEHMGAQQGPADDVSLECRLRVESCSDVGVPGVLGHHSHSYATSLSSGASSPWLLAGAANPITPGGLSPLHVDEDDRTFN